MKVSNTKPGYSLLMTTLKDFSLFIFLLLPLLTFAQNKISGVVTDGNGIKLAGVEVYNKSTSTKLFTDTNGSFEIEQKNQLVLILSFLRRATVLWSKIVFLQEV